VLILDEAAAEDEGALQAAWRRWLQMFNLMQFLPGQLLATAAGLDGDDYAGLAEAGLAGSSLAEAGLELTAASSSSLPPRGGGPGRGGQSGASTAPAQAADQAALNHIWLEVLDQVIGRLQPGLKQLARAGASIPEVGFELTDAASSLPPRGGGPGRGGQSVAATPQVRILAEAELAWPSVRLAVLRPDQEDQASTWRANGWHALPLDDSHSLVAGRPWTLAVAERLGLTLNPLA
jgi:DEAD/DEAH box helicase domain-containing protein